MQLHHALKAGNDEEGPDPDLAEGAGGGIDEILEMGVFCQVQVQRFFLSAGKLPRLCPSLWRPWPARKSEGVLDRLSTSNATLGSAERPAYFRVARPVAK
jgi:hypothetical protein